MIAKVNDLKILVIGNGFMLGGLFKFVLSLNSDQWLDWVFQTGCFAPGSTALLSTIGALRAPVFSRFWR
jgi:hypothetical protein